MVLISSTTLNVMSAGSVYFEKQNPMKIYSDT